MQCKRIEVRVSDYGASVLLLPLGAAFTSVRDMLGTPGAAKAFGRAMVRHRIVAVAGEAGPAGADDREEQGGGAGADQGSGCCSRRRFAESAA